MGTTVFVDGVNRPGPARRALETALADVRYHQVVAINELPAAWTSRP